MAETTHVETAPAATVFVDDSDMELTYKDNSNLFDQLQELIRLQRWTTQDEATLNITREMDNVHTAFLVRKSDGLLLGGCQAIDNPEHVYANVYVTRMGYRSNGMGMKLTFASIKNIEEQLKTKSMLGRAVTAMVEKYKRPPILAQLMYSMHSVEFQNKQDLQNFFPTPVENHGYQLLRVKEMTPSQWEEMVQFDKFVTGEDRREFLRRYYKIAFVEGIALRDSEGMKGMIGMVPTMEPSLYKVNPIYASSYEDAALLVNTVTNLVKESHARFVVHVRENSAGDEIIKKCKAEGIKMYFIGTTYRAGMFQQPYVDKAKTHLMIAPTNSPAYFDG